MVVGEVKLSSYIYGKLNIMEQVSFQDIVNELERYDWYHDYSDSSDVWKRGVAHRKKIVGMMGAYMMAHPTTKQELLNQLFTAVPERSDDGYMHKEIGYMVDNAKLV